MINEDILKVLRALYKTAGLSGAKLLWEEQKRFVSKKDLTILATMYRKGGFVPFWTKAGGGFGRNEEWIRLVAQYLRLHGLEMAAKITETMREDVIKILEMAVDEGWGIDETVRQLETRYVIPRARVIARTEINTATNMGHKAASKTLPYEVNKKWIAAKDERTRPGHRDINGHMVDEDDFFEVPIYEGNKKVGTEQMEGPGDPNASAKNRINCRCRRIYPPKRNASGGLIMRNPNQAPVIPMRRPQQIPLTGIAAVLKSNIKVGVE